MGNTCTVRRCTAPASLAYTFQGHLLGLCAYHWNELADRPLAEVPDWISRRVLLSALARPAPAKAAPAKGRRGDQVEMVFDSDLAGHA